MQVDKTMTRQLSKPIVSVCIPTCQGTAFIHQAIESVLMQTFTDFELVIVDDNPLDGSASAADSYSDPRIRYLRNHQNPGVEGNWNRCLAEARGRYFKLLPHDDLLAPDCLKQQVALLEADTDEQIALVFSARTIIDAAGRCIMTRNYPHCQGGRISSYSVLQSCLRRGTNLIGEPAGVLFRKPLADAIGGFDASIGYVVDLDYWFRLLLRGDAFYLPEKLASFRISASSWSVAIGNRQSSDFHRFIDRVAENPSYKTVFADIWAGRIMSWIQNLLRLSVYTFLKVRSVQR
jgi:glycosyltransferase involved in cell wall biosynthesis